MSILRLSWLGSAQIELDDQIIVLRRRKSVALLAYLAVTAVPHSRDFLATLLWPAYDQSRALAYLRRTLWEINQGLGKAWLQIDREQVQLDSDREIWQDTATFMQVSEQIDAGALQQADALYRGEFLEGFTLRDAPLFDEWQQAQRDWFCRQYGRCLQRLLGLAAADGALETAVAYATRWLALDNLNEEAHRQLICLYAHLGRRPTAVQQYETCARILKDELDLTPEAATQELFARIAQGDLPPLTPLINNVIPELPGGHRFLNLPHYLTPFIGREREFARIETLLKQPKPQLLTLVGPGGIGKTRLAVEVAQRYANGFADGVCFVPLAALTQPQSIPFALADALGLHVAASAEPLEIVVEYLRTKVMLLILDNFEHLLAGSNWAYQLLLNAPNVTLLVTSRRRLALPNEQLLSVPELSYPAESEGFETAERYDAVKLFTDRASHLRHDFDLAAPAVRQQAVQICRLAAGHPLVLEMAAAYVRWLALPEIIRELQHSMMQFEAAAVELEPRHRSLRAVFEYSWGILTSQEQDVLPRLAIFRDGFTYEAANAIIAFPHSVLASLIEKSFVQLLGNGRYTMHNVIQEFALEKLHANPRTSFAAQTQHWLYFADFLARQEADLKSEQVGIAFQRIHPEFANICAAWEFALSTKQFAEMEKALLSLWMYWGTYHSEEGRRILQRTAELLSTVEVDVPDRLLWKVMTLEIYLIGFFNRKEVVLQYAPDIIAYLRAHPDEDWDWLSFVIIGWAEAYGLIDQEEAVRLGEMFVDKARELDDPYFLSRALQGMGWMHLFTHQNADLELAKKYTCESAAVAGARQVLITHVAADWQLGFIAFRRQEYAEALRYGRSALAMARKAGLVNDVLLGLNLCFRAQLALKNLPEARRYLREYLAHPRSQSQDRQAVVLVFTAIKDFQEKRFAAAATAIAAFTSQLSPDGLPPDLREMRAQLEELLPTAVYQAALQRGQKLDIDALSLESISMPLPETQME